MYRRLQRSQRAAAFLVALLLLVPIVLSGHRHAVGQGRASDSCARCVVSHHSRSFDIAAAAAPPIELAPSGLAPTITGVEAPTLLNHQPKVPRAPPFSVHFA